MADGRPALLLPPGVSANMYQGPVGRESGSMACQRFGRALRLPPECLYPEGRSGAGDRPRALRKLGHPVSLTIAGTDGPSQRLDADIQCHGEWIERVRSPTRKELVDLYGGADVFVLASRQHRRPGPAGEGFGIVLAEAALAGLPVIAPANDGSRDAFVPGLTGMRPVDQSVDGLTDISDGWPTIPERRTGWEECPAVGRTSVRARSVRVPSRIRPVGTWQASGMDGTRTFLATRP